MDLGTVREWRHQLTYIQHGGSGYGFTLADVNEMQISEMLWYLDRLNEARKAEAEAIRAASARRK